MRRKAVNQSINQFFKLLSTETTFLFVNDDIIKAMSHQQITCLKLLDLPAAF